MKTFFNKTISQLVIFFLTCIGFSLIGILPVIDFMYCFGGGLVIYILLVFDSRGCVVIKEDDIVEIEEVEKDE